MQHFDDEATLARILPGVWTVKATNFPMWLSGERRDPSFEYGLLRETPLTLSDRVEYVDADGKAKTIQGVDHWNGRTFTWKMRGIAGMFVRSRWEVASIRQDLL